MPGLRHILIYSVNMNQHQIFALGPLIITGTVVQEHRVRIYEPLALYTFISEEMQSASAQVTCAFCHVDLFSWFKSYLFMWS